MDTFVCVQICVCICMCACERERKIEIVCVCKRERFAHQLLYKCIFTNPGCTVNIGNAMNPKSGEFRVPEAGLYLFLITCCTFDMKKCLLSIRKNGKDVANIFDQDGMENRVKFFISLKQKRSYLFLPRTLFHKNVDIKLFFFSSN